MGDVTTVGLGFQGAVANRFESAIAGQAAGSAAFYACVLVHARESLLVAPTECAYFGNFNNVNAGWEIGRAADVAASNPPNTPEIVTFRVRLGANGAVSELTYSMDSSTIFGRTHMLAVSVIGLTATFYINGTAVAIRTLPAAFTIGASKLTYGNRSGGGLRSGDPIVAAAYTETDAANFIANQRLLFDRVRSGGNLVASITGLGLLASYVYEGFSQKAPNLGVPTLPLTNFGTSSPSGDLTFVGSTALNVNIDPDPDYTGGAQSASGLGGVSLQDAYNVGNTIVTGAGPAVEIDTLNLLDGTLLGDAGTDVTVGSSTSAAVAPGTLFLQGGVNTSAAGGAPGGGVAALSGAGSPAIGGGSGGFGGQFVVVGGAGGAASGATETAGSGGEVNISAGIAGTVAGGAAPGFGGALQLSAGGGGDGIGGNVQLSSGAGNTQSGDLTIFVGPSVGVIGVLEVRGGNATGIGSGDGGRAELNGGNAAVGQGQNGGAAAVTGGEGDGATGSGGTVALTGGVSTLGPGGAVSIIGGPGGGGALDNGGFGGSAVIGGGAAGQLNQLGGYVEVAGGNASGTNGVGGRVDVYGGDFTGVAPGTGAAVRIGSGRSSAVGATGANAGDVEVSLARLTTASPAPGGFIVDSANGRMTLRNYVPGAAGTDDTGTLALHILDTAGEALQSPATDGLLHFQGQQAAGTATTVGFRASKSGDYGLMGRVYQRTFAAGETATFAVTHNLNCAAPVVVAYAAAGGAGLLLTVVQTSLDVVTVTLTAGATNGTVTVVGI